MLPLANFFWKYVRISSGARMREFYYMPMPDATMPVGGLNFFIFTAQSFVHTLKLDFCRLVATDPEP